MDVNVNYRPIPSWLGYLVGDDGSVWSCRTFKGQIGTTWRRLRCRKDRDGYLSVVLHRSGRRKTMKVARLVLLVFVGACPPGMESCHSPNNDPTDNRLANLRWGTHGENIDDRTRSGTAATGEAHGMAKLTDKQVAAIRRRYIPGARNGKPPSNAQALAEEFGVTAAHIGQIVARHYR